MEKLIEYFKANRGAQIRLARHLKRHASTISQWKSVPAEYVLAIEAFTGLSRHELRPDVFGQRTEAAE